MATNSFIFLSVILLLANIGVREKRTTSSTPPNEAPNPDSHLVPIIDII